MRMPDPEEGVSRKYVLITGGSFPFKILRNW
jgi:hypothetical protein